MGEGQERENGGKKKGALGPKGLPKIRSEMQELGLKSRVVTWGQVNRVGPGNPTEASS